MKELRLMKGNEALAEAAIRAGADGYFGYPITPQSEIIEYLMMANPYKKTGMIVLQAESEIASINMVYAGAACGKKVMTTSSSPGISLMLEGISYIAGAELPCLIVNVQRGGPGLGTISPAQSDYFQTTKGGGHGDYRLFTLAPASVQEMYDFVKLGFDMAFKYRNPVMILSDGVIGQMMEKVEVGNYYPRWTAKEIKQKNPWATTGKTPDRERNIITSLDLVPEEQDKKVWKLHEKYENMKQDVKYETFLCDDAEYLLVAYGSSARICQKTIELMRKEGIKIGLFRPITLYPYPSESLKEILKHVNGILSVEMNTGQMIEDVMLAVECKIKVEHFGRTGGIIPSPEEVVEAAKNKIIEK
jgi:2-oxoglutarate/2-oxoacid ferredoxin oxidoreductase subunit alpha